MTHRHVASRRPFARLATRRSFGRLAALLLVAGLAGCGQLGLDPSGSSPGEPTAAAASKARPGDDTIVAILDGREITQAELHRHMQEQFLDELLRQPESELYNMRERAIQDLVQRHVIDTAAAERGLTAEGLFDEVTGDVPEASLDDVTAWFTANEARLGGARMEDVAPRIQEMLTSEARSRAWSEFVKPRFDALAWSIEIDPPRKELAATRLVRGDPEAPITLTAFSDYQCPYCIRSEPVLAEVLQRYPGQVRLVHRHFPLDSIHPFARPASEAAMCADEQGRFWDFHDAIFARNGRLDGDSFTEIGEELALDLDALDTCIDERRYAGFVAEDFAAGEAAGVSGTPAFFVNGIALRGAQDADAISAVIDTELTRLETN